MQKRSSATASASPATGPSLDPSYAEWCSTFSVMLGFTPATAGRRWFSTCSAVIRNVLPRIETLSHPASSRKYRSVLPPFEVIDT